MRFAFTEEQDEFRRSVRRFLDKNLDAEKVRSVMETESGWDTALWQRLCSELGIAGIAIPEEFGGFGFGVVEHAGIMEVAGGALLASPLISTLSLTSPLLVGSGHAEACAEWLPQFSEGTATGAFALIDTGRTWSREGVTLTAARSGDRARLTGLKRAVIHGATADVLVVAVQLDGEFALCLVRRDANGVAAEHVPTMDQTNRRASVTFEGADALVLATGIVAERAFDRASAVARVSLACEQVGGAQSCLDDAVRYSTERIQFGRQIGSFQAVKHMAADMMVDVESARSAAYYAAWAADAGTAQQLAESSLIANAWCSEAYFACAGQNIQIHGGVGFTWEYDAHMHFKRATAGKTVLGSATEHRERIAAQLLDGEGA